MPPDLAEVAERYRTRTRVHADRTAETVVAAFLALGEDAYVPVAVAELVTARLRAGAYAGQYVDLLALIEGEVTVTELGTAIDSDRLAEATRTAGGLGVGSVERLARSEPLRAGQEALSEGWKANPALDRWTRGVAGTACPACQALAGGSLPASVPLLHPHPSCSCVQLPA